jgi:hypothetical protein
MTSRLSHAASVTRSRSAIAFARLLISGGTRAFNISVQDMGHNVSQKQAARYPAYMVF